MRVTIVTAEPLGAYHLTPLAAAIAASDASFTHLVPYEEPTQGHSAAVTTTSVTAIDRCGRLVITGGTLSAWTEIVARYAASLGTPIVFSELAYLGDCDPAESTVPVTHATALPPSSAGTVAHLLGLTHVEVTGTSSLVNLPVWSPLPRRALLMSAPDPLARDPQLTLVAAAHALRERGWDVRVRLHPREDHSLRHGVTLVDDETLAQSVSAAQVVGGYPGSALLPAAAMGAPVVAVAPTAAFDEVFPGTQAAVLAGYATSVDDILALVDTAQPPDRALVEAAVGPIGGASERLVNLWVEPLPR